MLGPADLWLWRICSPMQPPGTPPTPLCRGWLALVPLSQWLLCELAAQPHGTSRNLSAFIKVVKSAF